MLKKRIIKGIILIVIGLIIYLGISGNSNAETKFVDTYRRSVFKTNTSNEYGGIALQYVDYFNYEKSEPEAMFFCNRLGYPPILVNRVDTGITVGTPDVSRVITTDKTDTINPQIAYAMSIGILPMNFPEGSQESWDYLQVLVWDANGDVAGAEGGDGSDAADGLLASDTRTSAQLRENTQIEVKRFRVVYEQIFEKTIKQGIPLFKIEDKQASIFVDQNDGTYIYGPFQLKVNCDASQEAIDNLIREIMQEGSEKENGGYIDYNDDDFEASEAYIENFYAFHKSIDENFIKNNISDGNKKNLSYSINSDNKDDRLYSTIIVDNMGQPIDFPKMTATEESERNFFIKFNPYNDGAIINLGNGEDTEFFHLKVKYDSYINYKEHIQQCVLYTKGVFGTLTSDVDQLIPAGTLRKTYGDTSIKVNWKRLDPAEAVSRRIDWIGYLKGLCSPKDLTLYTPTSSGGVKFLLNSGTTMELSHSYTSDGSGNLSLTQSKYALDNYYTDLRCAGWSLDIDGISRGSSINIPFGFAGDSDVEINDAIAAIKDDYAFPLTQPMTFKYFIGIVKEKARAQYTATGTKTVTVVVKEAYTDDDGVYHEAETRTETKTDNWSTKKDIYRYRYALLYPDEVESLKSKITTSAPPSSTNSLVSIDQTKDDYTKPSTPSNSYSYGTVTETIIENWSITDIYGGRNNAELGTEGFIYETSDTGWNYDRNFLTYDQRLTLDQAILGHTVDYEYKEGDVSSLGIREGQYVIHIPRNFDAPPSDINTPGAGQAYYEASQQYAAVKGNMQSFISFEGDGEGDVFKYGTKQANEIVALPHLKIAEAFGGNIWKESLGVKGILEKDYDGIYDMDNEEAYQGVKVDLYECKIEYNDPYTGPISEEQIGEGTYLTSTFTDKDGDYRFYGKIAENVPLINPLRKYYVKFVYNGQIYSQTLYNVASNSEYGEYKDKTSKGLDEYRKEFNKRFENIYSDSNNYTYTGQRYEGCNGQAKKDQNYTYTGRAYGLKHVVQEAIDNPNFDSNLDTFEEQYNLFIKNNTHDDFIKTTAEYEFKHAGGNNLKTDILEGTWEIVRNDIDKYWENTSTLGQPMDYNFNGISESVKRYLQDCMIEASVPYTPDLDVYGKNIGKTDLHQKFPTQETFNLKDMTRTYMDAYRQWKYTWTYMWVSENDPRVRWETVIPDAIKPYVEGKTFPEGTVITLFEDSGEVYYHIDLGNGSGSQDIKVASLNDNYSIGFEDSSIKVAGQPDFDLDDPNPGDGPVGPDNPPGPGKKQLWGFQWEELDVGEIHDIDNIYIPDEEQYINLYNKEFDLRHCWSFGVYQRNFNQVELTKDLYKTTLVVNGKKEVYSYSSKLPNDDEDNYNISTKEDQLINLNKAPDGGDSYIGEIRKSDYLYDENISYGNGQYSKNIQAYLTYKIKVKNTSTYSVKINEIADYYDSDNLEFDGIRDQNGNLVVDSNGKYQIATHTQYDENGDVTTSKYTYVTDFSDTMGHDVNTEYLGIYNSSAYTHDSNGNPSYVSETFDIANNGQDNNGQPYHLKTLYIRGADGNGVPILTKKGGLTNELIPGQSTIIFVTFKVKNNTIDNNIATFANHIKLDQITRDFVNELPTIGKNNFAEINSYATYYTADAPSDANGIEKEYYRPYGEGKIKYGNGKATYLDFYNNPVGEETDPDICIAGVVDVYSNPGSFDTRDVEVVYTNNNKYKTMQFVKNTRTIVRPYGSMLNRNDPYEESLPDVEPDMDKAPAIRLILDDDQIRKISGYVFEDARTVNSDGSKIGNGEYNKADGDTPINGVTVQLVELIQDVDYDGTFTGQYIGEKVWDECEYTGENSTSGNKYQLKAGSQNQGVQYYSGKGTKYILNSTSDLTQIYSDPSVANEATEDGKYCFAGLPSGDFIVRFIYGDTDRTVLTKGTYTDEYGNEVPIEETNNDNETAGPIKETAAVNALVGNHGMNVKSYNGQDYKSTVYQRKLNTNSSTDYQVNQDAISYKMKGENEVKGYVDTVNQDYASTYNYNSSELRTKEQLYDSNVIYYTGQPINNTGDLTTAGDAGSTNPRDKINNSYGSMWRYDRVATSDKLDLSDANDLYGYRQRGIDYAQGYTTGVSEEEKTLLNYRAEVLSSFERLTSQEYKNSTTNAQAQRAMINELEENTYMVAQTGIISMNEEYEGFFDNDKYVGDDDKDNLTTLHRVNATYENHAKQVDLGLVERPKAQVKLTKQVSNLEIKLADGQTLFNSNTAVKDLIYDNHKEHIIDYSGNTLENARIALNPGLQETIQASMDDEIMNGATVNVTYHLKVENVGEIDYQDRDFYYYGRKSAATNEPVRTKVVRVIDYVPNDLSYDASKQNSDAHWDVYEPNDLMPSGIKGTDKANINIVEIEDTQDFADDVAETYDGKIYKIEPRNATGSFYDKVNRDYVSRAYRKEVATYNTIVVTKDMNDNLLPTMYGQGQNDDKTTLILTTSITSSGDSEDLTYNNLAEVIETSNSYGRRMAFSISGNQEMANQDMNDVGSYQDHHAYSSSKIAQPREIDADSAQRIQILPPTGSQDYRNTIIAIITTVIATIIVLVGAIIIKKKVYNK